MDLSQAMDPRYGPYLASLLGVAGAGLQWLRANRVPDRLVVLLGVAAGLAGWSLVANWTAAGADPRLFVLQHVQIIPGCLASVFGGTFMASKVATAAVSAGADPRSPLVPVTNNREVPR